MSNELLEYAKTITQLLRSAAELESKDDQRAAEVYKIAKDYVKELLQKLNEIVDENKEGEKE